jgi:hypothetical protein
MATQAAHDIPTDPALPLYRLDGETYARLVEAGALDGAQVGLRDGLLVDMRSGRGGVLHRLDTETYDRMVATGALADEPRNGVPTYWFVDVPRRAVEVRSDPGPQGYRRCEIYELGDRVPSPAEGVADLDVAWLFDETGG